VLAYRVPVAVLDNIFQWIPDQKLAEIHWIADSSDVAGMQTLDTLWTSKAHIVMCIFPEAGRVLDEALFEVFCSEWPSGGVSAVVFHCDGHQPLGPLSTLNSLGIDVSIPLGELSKQVAADLTSLVRGIGGS
jgi:hypothetical protein